MDLQATRAIVDVAMRCNLLEFMTLVRYTIHNNSSPSARRPWIIAVCHIVPLKRSELVFIRDRFTLVTTLGELYYRVDTNRECLGDEYIRQDVLIRLARCIKIVENSPAGSTLTTALVEAEQFLWVEWEKVYLAYCVKNLEAIGLHIKAMRKFVNFVARGGCISPWLKSYMYNTLVIIDRHNFNLVNTRSWLDAAPTYEMNENSEVKEPAVLAQNLNRSRSAPAKPVEHAFSPETEAQQGNEVKSFLPVLFGPAAAAPKNTKESKAKQRRLRAARQKAAKQSGYVVR